MKTLRLIIAVSLVFPSLIYAREGTVTVKEAITLALGRNNLLKAAEQQKYAAEHGAASSRSRYFPRIFLDENFSASNAPTRVFMMKLDQGRFSQNDFVISNLNNPSADTDFRTAFTLEQPVFDLSIFYGTEAAQKEAEEKGFALEMRREEVGFRVFAAYLEVQKARAMLAAAERAVSDAREHLRLARVRGKAGTGLKSDELRAGAFLAETEQQEITAKNDLILAGMRLALATGAKEGESLDISETVSGLTLDGENLDFMTVALQNRKDLREMEKTVEKAGVGVKMAASAFFPTLYATATYQMNDRDVPFGRSNDAWIAGVNLRWELFDGMRRFEERARSRALESSGREYLEQQAKEVTFQVRESLLRREEAGKRLAVAKAACLDAEEGVRLISKRFANSLAILVEVLDAQTSLNRARASVVEHETGYALATARVWFSAGIFLREAMK
ncbi:MAG: TolC family protein [Geobacteraceae bacterium]|nr:TolC family protein [Geobacteraceae bacterium]